MDMQWTLPSRMEQNPMAWMISVNGFIVDARSLPRSLQEEAYRKGLIPYIPEEKDDRMIKPGSRDRKASILITGMELDELQRFDWMIAEAFGLDRRIA